MVCSVLVVDDFEPFVQILGSLLPSERFHITAHACDGLEAVEKAETGQPDLILLDVGLPGLNGIEVAKCVKKVAPRATILMVSQDLSPEVVTEALDAGALGYVHKQRARRELLTAIEAVLAGRQFISSGLLTSYPKPTPSPEPPRNHRVLFCANDSELLAGLGSFIAEALAANTPVISVVTQPHRECLIQSLRERGLDLEAAMSKRQCLWFDAADPPDVTHLSAAIVALATATSSTGIPERGPRIAACGELAGRLWAQGRTGEALKLERLCDDLAKRYGLEILCAYPAGYTPEADDDSDRIFAIHSH